MSNLIRSTTNLAMNIFKEYISDKDIVIDATCGNGYDTLNLAKCRPYRLYAFDIQKHAISNAKALLTDNGFSRELKNESIFLICDSHENMYKYIDSRVSAIIFNLGYLPGGDKTKTTSASSTLNAVNSGLELLKKDGLICITMYSGHEEGAKEKEALISLAKKLDSSIYHVAYINMLNQYKNPPEILLITKKCI